jgi:hypothetical protein
MVGPFPGWGAGFGHGAILFGALAVVVGAIVALFLFVALVAFLFLLVRFLIVGTKAAELYIAEHAAREEPAASEATDEA